MHRVGGNVTANPGEPLRNTDDRVKSASLFSLFPTSLPDFHDKNVSPVQLSAVTSWQSCAHKLNSATAKQCVKHFCKPSKSHENDDVEYCLRSYSKILQPFHAVDML